MNLDPVNDLCDEMHLSALLSVDTQQRVQFPVEPRDQPVSLGLVVTIPLRGALTCPPVTCQGLGPQVRHVHLSPEVGRTRPTSSSPDVSGPQRIVIQSKLKSPISALESLTCHGGVVAESPGREEEILKSLDIPTTGVSCCSLQSWRKFIFVVLFV